ncbi:MAG: thioredoxin family protein [Promethearchaeota archaeon]
MTEEDDPILEKLKQRRLQQLQDQLKTKQQEEVAKMTTTNESSQPSEPPLPMSISHLTDLTFMNFMKTYSHRLPVFVDYWAPWCRPCIQIAPVVENLAYKYHGKFIFAKIDTQANPRIPSTLGIQGIPTFHIWKNEKVIAQLVGAQPYNKFTSWLNLINDRIKSGRIP